MQHSITWGSCNLYLRFPLCFIIPGDHTASESDTLTSFRGFIGLVKMVCQYAHTNMMKMTWYTSKYTTASKTAHTASLSVVSSVWLSTSSQFAAWLNINNVSAIDCHSFSFQKKINHRLKSALKNKSNQMHKLDKLSIDINMTSEYWNFKKASSFLLRLILI